MIPVVILASGRGSNFEALYRQNSENAESGVFQIQAVLSDQPQALVLKKAEQWGIPALSVPFPEARSCMSLTERRLEHGKKILDQLAVFKPRFLILAGYMRILSPIVIEAFRSERGYSRIVNIHPSLLPAFPGVHSYAQAFEYGAKVAGVTIHLVDEGLDLGPVCAQEAFSIADCKSAQEVEKKGLAIEHRLFAKSLSWILPENFKVEKREKGRLCVSEN